MYTKQDLYKRISGAGEAWLPNIGQVFPLTLTPKERECLLAFLAPEDAILKKLSAIGDEIGRSTPLPRRECE